MDTITDVGRSADRWFILCAMIFFPSETVPSVHKMWGLTLTPHHHDHRLIFQYWTTSLDHLYLYNVPGCLWSRQRTGSSHHMSAFLSISSRDGVVVHHLFVAFIQPQGTQLFGFHRAHAVALSSRCIILNFSTHATCVCLLLSLFFPRNKLLDSGFDIQCQSIDIYLLLSTTRTLGSSNTGVKVTYIGLVSTKLHTVRMYLFVL